MIRATFPYYNHADDMMLAFHCKHGSPLKKRRVVEGLCHGDDMTCSAQAGMAKKKQRGFEEKQEGEARNPRSPEEKKKHKTKNQEYSSIIFRIHIYIYTSIINCLVHVPPHLRFDAPLLCLQKTPYSEVHILPGAW